MQQEPVLLVLSPGDFLEKIKRLMEEVVDERINRTPHLPAELEDKTLLLPTEVCRILRISKTTFYEMIKAGKLKGFKIRRKRYFARTDVEKIIIRQYQ